MLNLGDIKIEKIIVVNNAPYLVVKTDHHKVARGGAVLNVRLKNLIDGGSLAKTLLMKIMQISWTMKAMSSLQFR